MVKVSIERINSKIDDNMNPKIIKIMAKKAFTRTKIPGAQWVINQYIGCQHACLYCYAKFMGKWYDYGEWGNWVVVKENIPELVKKERVTGRVYMSSVSDAYQPIERDLELTRRILENMDKSTELSILTKSELVLRDVDIFRKFESIEVGLTINGFSEMVKREIEPYTTTNERRINALKTLYEKEINNYAFISPIIPGLVNVENLIQKTKDFTDFYIFEFLNLRASGKEFRDWLSHNYPRIYEFMHNEAKYTDYVMKVKDIIYRSGVRVENFVLHYNTAKY